MGTSAGCQALFWPNESPIPVTQLDRPAVSDGVTRRQMVHIECEGVTYLVDQEDVFLTPTPSPQTATCHLRRVGTA